MILLSCPFCDGNDLEVTPVGDDRCTAIAAVCNNCACEGPTALTTDEAVTLWNSRPKQGDVKSMTNLVTNVVFDGLRMAHAARDIKVGDALYLNDGLSHIGWAARDIKEGQAIYYNLSKDTTDVIVSAISIVNLMTEKRLNVTPLMVKDLL